MPKSGGNFKNDQINQPNVQQQSLPHRGALSYENLSSVPSSGAQSTTGSVYYQPPQNAHENTHHINALTAQQINAVAHHHHHQLMFSPIHQKSNQALNNVQSEPTHHGSFGNISAPNYGRIGVISSGVSSSSTTSLDETQNTLVSQHQLGSRNNVNSTNLNNEQSTGDQIALPEGWDMGRDYDGKIYFINHHTQTTTWVDPRERYVILLYELHGIV